MFNRGVGHGEILARWRGSFVILLTPLLNMIDVTLIREIPDVVKVEMLVGLLANVS